MAEPVDTWQPGRDRTVAHITTVHRAGDTRITQKECRSLV